MADILCKSKLMYKNIQSSCRNTSMVEGLRPKETVTEGETCSMLHEVHRLVKSTEVESNVVDTRAEVGRGG